ncbi:MAG: PKD domain-containing protein, partial [Chlorobi bacterium]|nr:PKD domain-containing protein [Chlorobiota bacterium]
MQGNTSLGKIFSSHIKWNWLLAFFIIILHIYSQFIYAEPHEKKVNKIHCGGGPTINVTITDSNCAFVTAGIGNNTNCAVTVDWGDGNVSSGITGASHCYATCDTFTINVTVDCGGGCVGAGAATVIVELDIQLQTNTITGCEGDSIELEAIVQQTSYPTPVPPFTYNWKFGDGHTGTGNPVSHVYNNPGSYAGSVVVTDASGCIGRDYFYVDILPKPNPMLPDTLVKCSDDTILIDISVFGATPPYTYQWQPPDYLSCTTCEDPLTSTPFDTTYYVTVTDANGCSRTDSVFINVFPQPVLTAEPDTICPKDTTSINLTLVSG